MPKRLTVTEKWNDEWFLNLSPQAKVCWEYVRDNCDLSGVFEVNVELMRFRIKFSSQVDIWKHLIEFNEVAKKLGFSERVEFFADKKRLWIVNFIKVQYGSVLNEKSSVHRGVIKVIKFNQLMEGLPKAYKALQGIKNHNQNKNQNNEGVQGEHDLWTEAKNSFLNSTDAWVMKFCSEKKVGEARLKKLMHEFITDQELKEEIKSFRELRSYFLNWFNQKRNHTDPEPQNGIPLNLKKL